MSMISEAEKNFHKLKELPDIFYRYRFVDNTIVVEKVEKTTLGDRFFVQCLMADVNGRTRKSPVSRPYEIEFGVYDGSRKCVFFKEGDKETEAAFIFDQHYDEVISKCELKVRDCILKRKALQAIIKKGG